MANLRYRSNRRTYLLEYRDPGDTTNDPRGRRYQINVGPDKETAEMLLLEVERKIRLVQAGLLEKVGHILGKDKQNEEQRNRIRIADLKGFHANLARKELNHKEETIGVYNNAFDSFISAVGNQYVDEITVADVRAWRDVLMGDVPGTNSKPSDGETPKSKTTISMWGRSLKAAWNRAIKEQYAEQNPFRDVRWAGPSETRRRDKSMSVEEVDRLLRVTRESGELQLWVYFLCLLYTGLRRQELLRIQGKHIDLENRTLLVMITKKRGEPIWMKVPINKQLYAILREIDIKPEEYLFKTTARKKVHRESGKPWSKWYVTHKFKEMAAKAGLPERYTLHSFRKTFITYLSEKGVPTNIIQRLVGHSSPTITFQEYDSSEAVSYAPFVDLMDIGAKSDEDE